MRYRKKMEGFGFGQKVDVLRQTDYMEVEELMEELVVWKVQEQFREVVASVLKLEFLGLVVYYALGHQWKWWWVLLLWVVMAQLMLKYESRWISALFLSVGFGCLLALDILELGWAGWWCAILATIGALVLHYFFFRLAKVIIEAVEYEDIKDIRF